MALAMIAWISKRWPKFAGRRIIRSSAAALNILNSLTDSNSVTGLSFADGQGPPGLALHSFEYLAGITNTAADR